MFEIYTKHKINFIMVVNLSSFLLVPFFLFLIGSLGIVLNKKSLIIIIMSIELILLGVSLNFVVFSVYIDDG